MSGTVGIVLVLGLFVGAGIVFLKRCEEPFVGLGLCTDATGSSSDVVDDSTSDGGGGGGGSAPDVNEKTYKCCTCRRRNGRAECQKDGKGNWIKYASAPTDTVYAATLCNKSCGNKPNSKGITKKPNKDGSIPKCGRDEVTTASGCKKISGRGGCCNCKIEASGLVRCSVNGVNKGTFGKDLNAARKYCADHYCSSGASYARSYFTSPGDIRPYRTFRGRMSL